MPDSVGISDDNFVDALTKSLMNPCHYLSIALIWWCCRQGLWLCWLFNVGKVDKINEVTLDVFFPAFVTVFSLATFLGDKCLDYLVLKNNASSYSTPASLNRKIKCSICSLREPYRYFSLPERARYPRHAAKALSGVSF